MAKELPLLSTLSVDCVSTSIWDVCGETSVSDDANSGDALSAREEPDASPPVAVPRAALDETAGVRRIKPPKSVRRVLALSAGEIVADEGAVAGGGVFGPLAVPPPAGEALAAFAKDDGIAPAPAAPIPRTLGNVTAPVEEPSSAASDAPRSASAAAAPALAGVWPAASASLASLLSSPSFFTCWQPRQHTSVVTGTSPAHTRVVSASVCEQRCVKTERPKSVSVKYPLASTRTLDAFKSRWTTPLL
jgi:hypothetical protein